MVDDRKPGPVESRRQNFLRQRHANRIAQTLPQRPGGRFDADVQIVLWVPRGSVTQLPKVAQLIDVNRIAGQVSNGIQQHRAVSIG